MSKEDELNDIINLISTWITTIRIRNALSYTDINKIAESFCVKLLNLVYGFQLQDLNEEHRDFHALDLGDNGKAKIGFQITSSNTAIKVRRTLQKTIKYGLHIRFHGGIKFLILNIQKISFGKKNDPSLILSTFNKTRDILYPEDLIQAIRNIYDVENFSLYYQIKDLVYRELRPLAVVSESEVLNEIRSLKKHIYPPHVAPKYLTTPINPSAPVVIGRAKSLSKLDQLLLGFDSCLLVNAYGGMGKSTLINEYVHSRAESFNKILYIELKIDFEVQKVDEQRALDLLYQAFVFEPVLQENLGLKLIQEKSLQEDFELIINKLANVDTFNNLMIIDNVPPAIKRIKKFLPPSRKWKVLAASRKRIKYWETYDMPPLNYSDAYKLFEIYFGKTKEKDTLKKIITFLQRHTFAIILFASSARQNGWTLQELFEKLKLLNIHYDELTPIETSYNFDSLNAIQHLINVFLIDELDELQKSLPINTQISRFLLYFSVLPSVAFDYLTLFKWSKLDQEISEREFLYVLNLLSDGGWLSRGTDQQHTTFLCHSVVQLAVQAQLKPDSKNCKQLIESLIEITDVNTSEGEHGIFKKELLTYAESVFNAIYKESESYIAEDKYLANLADNIGWIAIDMADPAKSFYYRSKDVAIKEQVLDATDEHLGSSYSNLGLVHRHLKDYLKSILLYDKCIDIFISTDRFVHKELANAYGNKAYVYLKLEQFDLMLENILKAHEISLKVYGPDNPLRGQSFNNVGECYRKVKDYPKALAAFEESKRIRELTLKPINTNHPDLSDMYNNLGMLYFDIGDVENARSYITDALEIRKISLGVQHQMTIECQENFNKIWGNSG